MSRTPSATHGWNSTVMYWSGEASAGGMPRFRKKFPNTLLNTSTTANSQVFSRSRACSWVMRGSVARTRGRGRRARRAPRGRLVLGHKLLPFGPQRQVLAGLLGQPPALFAVEHGLLHDAPDDAQAEEILAVEALHPLHQFSAVEPRINHVGKLVAGFIGHGIDGDEVVLLDVIVELGARIRMGDGDLDGFRVQPLGEIDGLADALARLARQPDNVVAMNQQAELLAVGREALGHLHGGALLDVLQDLRVARFVSHNQQPAAGFLHGSQGLVIGGHARGARPREVQRLQLLRQFDGAVPPVIEGVVVEENLFDVGELIERIAHFMGHVVGRAQAPAVPRVGLRPQAERAQRRASARSVHGNEWVQQERHVVARDVEIALVNPGHPRERIQVFDRRRFRVVDDGAVPAETHAGQLLQWLAVGVVHNLAIELPPHHEIDGFGAAQRFFRLRGDGRTDERHLQLGVRVLHHPGYLGVHVETGSGSIEYEQFEILGHLDRLPDGDLVRRRVHHFAVGEHAGGVTKPDGIPVGLDFARGRPAGTGAAVEPFKRRRIQKQCSHLLSSRTSARPRYWLSASLMAPRLALSIEKLLKSMVRSALPANRVSTSLRTCRGTEIPSRISYFLTNATFFRKMDGLFTRYPDSRTRR